MNSAAGAGKPEGWPSGDRDRQERAGLKACSYEVEYREAPHDEREDGAMSETVPGIDFERLAPWGLYTAE